MTRRFEFIDSDASQKTRRGTSMTTKSKVLGMAFALTALAAAVAGCGTTSSQSNSNSSTGGSVSSSGGKAQQTIKVAMIPKAMGVPYFTAAYDGAKSVASQLHIQLTYNGPTSNPTAASQASLINSFVAQHYNVIVISSIDPQGVAPALENAMKHGVLVEAWDADTIPQARDVMVQATTSEYLVSVPVETIAKKVNGAQTDIAIMSDTPTDQQHNLWIAAMKKLMASKYPNLHIVDIGYGQSEPGPSLTAAENILKAYPNVKAIIPVDAAAYPAVGQAVDQLGEKGKIIVTGIGDPGSLKKYIENGTATNVALWDVNKYGKMAMYAARALYDGDIHKGSGQVTLGNFGTFQEKNSIIYMGKAFVWDKSNIASVNY